MRAFNSTVRKKTWFSNSISGDILLKYKKMRCLQYLIYRTTCHHDNILKTYMK
jgi:hypothetical protein